jgi:hypothetical protein
MLHMFLCTSRMRFTRSWTTFVDLRTKCVTAVQQCLFGTVLWHENNKIRLREMCLRGPSDVCPLISLVRSQKNGHRFGEANFADPGEISNELHDDQPLTNGASTGRALFLWMCPHLLNRKRVRAERQRDPRAFCWLCICLQDHILGSFADPCLPLLRVLCPCQIHSTTRKWSGLS